MICIPCISWTNTLQANGEIAGVQYLMCSSQGSVWVGSLNENARCSDIRSRQAFSCRGSVWLHWGADSRKLSSCSARTRTRIRRPNWLGHSLLAKRRTTSRCPTTFFYAECFVAESTTFRYIALTAWKGMLLDFLLRCLSFGATMQSHVLFSVFHVHQKHKIIPNISFMSPEFRHFLPWKPRPVIRLSTDMLSPMARTKADYQGTFDLIDVHLKLSQWLPVHLATQSADYIIA